MHDTTLLLVGHGSRQPAGNAEIERFAALWRERHPDWRIDVCFIEYADVLLDAGLDRAAQSSNGSGSIRRVIVIPFILNAAGHVKMEMPAAIAAARARHPEVRFDCLRHLGMGPEVLAILEDQRTTLLHSLDMPDPRSTGVILLGRGSSDAGANGELAKMARWIFEAADHDLVDIAFTGVAWPRLETVVQRQVRLGMTQILVIPVYLFTGVLIERIAAQLARLRRQYPQIAFAASEHFGFDPRIAALLDARLAAHLAADLEHGDAASSLLECDGCKYRQAAEEDHLHDHSHTGAHAHGAGHAAHGHADMHAETHANAHADHQHAGHAHHHHPHTTTPHRHA
ncbi:sirohydrochlorin chelatase [Rhodocyclus gracilis]|uniref:Sirohydrochlorin chelatase n=1 Tax=Rhodocyclus tenuis TaxID=1066 RepID=A0A6L5JXG6_RHOTE|nr:sirohydrochlorin chelatase [Rhodocyclus gracilis]MQY52057.1 sirohydrochlorin chelatase [Rhodocyclus gracilis]